MNETSGNSPHRQSRSTKSFILVPILCSLAIILAAVFYVVENYPVRTDADKPPSKGSSKEAEGLEPVPTTNILQKNEEGHYVITDAMIECFRITDVGTETEAFLRGAATGEITLFQPEQLSVTPYHSIFTAVVDEQRIICGLPWSADASSVSKDGTTLAFLNDGLMVYDMEMKVCEKVSNDNAGGYNSRYFKNISLGDGCGVIWMDNPEISEDNLLITYESNRRTYDAYAKAVRSYEGEGRIPYPASDIWMKDLESGREYLLLKNANAWFWIGRSLVYTSSDSIYIIDVDTKETKKLPDGFTTAVPNTYYIKNWTEDELRLYNVKTDKSYLFSLYEEGLQVAGEEIYIAEDGKEYAIISYHSNEKDTNGFYRYFLGIIDIESGKKNIYAFPDSINQRGSVPSIDGIVGTGSVMMLDHRYSSYEDFFLIHLGDFGA